MMGDIYRSASEVFIWLGTAARSESQASASLQELADLPSADDHDLANLVTNLSRLRRTKAFSVLAFMSRPWFGRAWTV